MLKLTGISRAGLLGVLFAMVAFSYALATSSGVGEGAVGAASRALGTNPLHFTNPLVSVFSPADANGTDRDLGDAVAGSQFARFCRAAGGVPPYKFASTVTPTLASLNLGVSLQVNGLVAGSMAGGLTAGAKRFRVTVTDSSGSTAGASAPVTEFFRITIVDGNTFKFGVGPDLGEAVQLREFATKLDVIGNTTPASFTTSSVALAGDSAVNSLDDVGLFLANDGTLYGKPLKAGVLTFKADCVGANGQNARSRDGLTVGQNFTLTITANTIVSTNILTTSAQIKGGSPGKDSIKFQALANLNGRRLSDLTGDEVSLRIGAYVSPANSATTPTTLDAKGKTNKPTVKNAAAVTLKGAVASTGKVSIAIGKETLTAALFGGTLTDGSTILLPVGAAIGDAVTGTETLPFLVKNKSGKFSLSFKLGAPAPAGSFFLLKIAGKDDTKGATPADAWKVSLVAQPKAGTAGNSGNMTVGSFAQARNADVTIGGFSDDIGVTESKGKIKSDKVADSKAANQVVKLAMEAKKGKGSVQTSFVGSSNSDIQEAGTAGAGNSTDFGMNITVTNNSGAEIYSGEAGLKIYSTGKAWTEKQPR
jgi:hypothetical protein